MLHRVGISISLSYLFRPAAQELTHALGDCQVIVTGDFLLVPPVRTNESEGYDISVPIAGVGGSWVPSFRPENCAAAR